MTGALLRGAYAVAQATASASLAAGAVLLSLAVPLDHVEVFVALLAVVPVGVGAVATRCVTHGRFTLSGVSAAMGIGLVTGFRSAASDGGEIGAVPAFFEGAVIGVVPGLIAVAIVASVIHATRASGG